MAGRTLRNLLQLTMVLSAMSVLQSYTDDRDVFAINSLYTSLGSPSIPGWTANGGDPCMDQWQGVQCVGSNITAIIINAANLGGELGDYLANFTSLITMDLSNNNIGGSIPVDLPTTMQKFFLSGNQFTGSIPSSLSKLIMLTDMSLNGNHLSGELPDCFESLSGLINLDISSNNLSGQLPPSMGNLSSVTTLHIQDNQLSGMLTALEDLPLKDLNIENNLFSGPVPVKLLNIPNFKKDGNPFNTTVLAPPPSPFSVQSPSSTPKASSPSSTPTNFSAGAHNSSDGGIAHENAASPAKGNGSMLKSVGYVLVAAISLVILVLAALFFRSKHQERKSKGSDYSRNEIGKMDQWLPEQRIREPLSKNSYDVNKASETPKMHNNNSNSVIGGDLEIGPYKKNQNLENIDFFSKSIINSSSPPLPPMPPVQKVIVKPIVHPDKTSSSPQGQINSTTSVTSFSVANLQQYTNSFSEGNLIREGWSKSYLAELPDGKLLEVMKIGNVNSRFPVEDFLQLVLKISEIKHPNITGLVGYCAEFDQRLLIYNFFSKKNLHDVLHSRDSFDALSWYSRLHVALGAAKALEYLHDGCQPALVHQNFEPANILINNKLDVCISGCGLAPLLSTNSAAQLSGRMRAIFGYEAPEINETGIITDRCDVYSFGVVMLELLTGRKPYDRKRLRAEQHLVSWANKQLCDIDALLRMVDPSIQGQCSEKALSLFADIISRCIQAGPEFRPPMSEVVQDLARIVKDLPGSSR